MSKSLRILEAVGIYFLLQVITSTSVHAAKGLDKRATYNKAIKVIPTLVSFKVETLTSDDIPEGLNSGLRPCDTFYDYWPEEEHGKVMSFRLNNCSSMDPSCSYNVINSEMFEAKIIFKAGGISRNPRLFFEGIYVTCGLIGCFPLWVTFTPTGLSLGGPLTNGTIYGITVQGVMSLDGWDMPEATYEFDSSYAAIGDYVDYGCDYDYEECEYDGDDINIRPNILEEWENLEMCFETTLVYHRDRD